jgi:hypothetical protein
MNHKELLEHRAAAHEIANADFEELEKRTMSYLDMHNIANLKAWKRRYYGLADPKSPEGFFVRWSGRIRESLSFRDSSTDRNADQEC